MLRTQASVFSIEATHQIPDRLHLKRKSFEKFGSGVSEQPFIDLHDFIINGFPIVIVVSRQNFTGEAFLNELIPQFRLKAFHVFRPRFNKAFVRGKWRRIKISLRLITLFLCESIVLGQLVPRVIIGEQEQFVIITHSVINEIANASLGSAFCQHLHQVLGILGNVLR